MYESLTQCLEEARKFARLHVSEGARELIEYATTSVLKEGRVRECAEILVGIGVHGHIPASHTRVGIAKEMFIDVALEIAAEKTE